jgi:hypothetical protein
MGEDREGTVQKCARLDDWSCSIVLDTESHYQEISDREYGERLYILLNTGSWLSSRRCHTLAQFSQSPKVVSKEWDF